MRGLTAFLIISMASLTSIRPIAAGEQYSCNMMALTPAEQASYQELAQTLLASIQEKKELRDGYAFRLPPDKLVETAQWVSFERRCCPFFVFEFEIERNEGPLWLRITGAKGIKEFIRTEFGL